MLEHHTHYYNIYNRIILPIMELVYVNTKKITSHHEITYNTIYQRINSRPITKTRHFKYGKILTITNNTNKLVQFNCVRLYLGVYSVAETTTVDRMDLDRK